MDQDDNNAPGRVAGYYLVFTEGKGSADFELERKQSTTWEKTQDRGIIYLRQIHLLHY